MNLPLDKKTVENQDWAAGPPNWGAVQAVGRGLLGLRASGPLGRRGPPGRRPAFSKIHF